MEVLTPLYKKKTKNRKIIIYDHLSHFVTVQLNIYGQLPLKGRSL